MDKQSQGDSDVNYEDGYNRTTDGRKTDALDFGTINLTDDLVKLPSETRIACVPFSASHCLQPFGVSICTNALLLIDFHSHMINEPVMGYLAGKWDPAAQQLSVTQAYPVKANTPAQQAAYTKEVKSSLKQKGAILVGWYQSCPNGVFPNPTMSDIRKQLAFQKSMLSIKNGLMNYSPCIGIIASPYYRRANYNLTSLMQAYWVMPLLLPNQTDFGRPMQIKYKLVRDAFLTQDLLVEMVSQHVLYFFVNSFFHFSAFTCYFPGTKSSFH